MISNRNENGPIATNNRTAAKFESLTLRMIEDKRHG